MIKEFIVSYTNEVAKIDEYFKKKYSIDDVLRSVRLNIIPKNGDINGGKYYFHGIGCKVEFPDKKVNFDYSPKGVFGGFSAYDLELYITSLGYDISEEKIKKELVNLLEKDEIIYPKLPPNTSLYYLKNYLQEK